MSATTSDSKVRNKLPNFKSSPKEADNFIDITKDEFTRISDALKNEKFRKLFLDYCEEIQDPVNRQRHEDEIKQFEAERGVEVRFIKPEPGFVIKTSVDGAKKCFVNVAKCAEVAKPTNKPSIDDKTGTRGLNWAIPMAQSGPRDDLDAHGKLCRVFDVVFHPDALHLAQRNPAFHKCLVDTALDAVEREYKVNLDRTNLKFPKMQFKGMARPTVIRKLAEDAPTEAAEPHPLEGIYPPKPTASASEPKVIPLKNTLTERPEYTTPTYTIKHRRDVDLAEYTDELDAKLNVTVPRELIVEIELPLLKSTAECQLDVSAKSLYLLSEKPGARYRLKLDLPYSVDDKEGLARFDTDKRSLCITLPVVQQGAQQQRVMHDTLVHLNREDSGVESDVRDENSNSGESPLSDPIKEKEAEELATNNVDDDDNSATKAVAPITPATFLKSSIHYTFPTKFNCNVLDNVMSLVLQVRNVQPESIATLEKEKMVHVQFTSIGSGYYPTYYAFLVQLPTETDFKIESVSAEAWENNVVLNLKLNANCEILHTYFAGLDEKDLQPYSVHGKLRVVHGSRQRKKSQISSFDISVERSVCEKWIEVEIKPRDAQLSSNVAAINTNEDEEMQQQRKKSNKKQKKKNKKRRSLSESAYEDIKAYHKNQQKQEERYPPMERATCEKLAEATVSTTEGEQTKFNKLSATVAVPRSTQQRIKHRSYSESRDSVTSSSSAGTASFKGILKHYSRYDPRPSISGSSSSIDDCCSYSCSIDAGAVGSLRFSQSFSDIPEENANVNLSESCKKKAVRFNEVIKKQVFRLDSSILGQRKKNQKRRSQKLRAMQRRHSEGDSADYEEIKPVSSDGNARNYFKPENQNNNSSNLNKPTRHDSGLDLSNGQNSNQTEEPANMRTTRPHLESESSSDIDNKNSMMFEMDM